MRPDFFIDTNVFVRHALNDHSEHSPLARALISSIDSGEVIAETSATVVFETVHVLHKVYGIERANVADTLRELVAMPGLHIPNRSQIQAAFNLWLDFGRLSFADAYHLVLTSNSSHKRIASFDQGLDRCLPGVTRVEEFP